jgi:hypothetical protein
MTFVTVFRSDARSALACVQARVKDGSVIIRLHGEVPPNAKQLLSKGREEFNEVVLGMLTSSDSANSVKKTQTELSVDSLYRHLLKGWDGAIEHLLSGHSMKCTISDGKVFKTKKAMRTKTGPQMAGATEAVQGSVAGCSKPAHEKELVSAEEAAHGGVLASADKEPVETKVVTAAGAVDAIAEDAVSPDAVEHGDKGANEDAAVHGGAAVGAHKASGKGSDKGSDKVGKVQGGVAKPVKKGVKAKTAATKKDKKRTVAAREVVIGGEAYVLKDAMQQEVAEHVTMFESSIALLKSELSHKDEQVAELRRASGSSGASGEL